MTDPFEEGCEAFASDETKSDNPYSEQSEPDEWGQWLDGFNEASFGD